MNDEYDFFAEETEIDDSNQRIKCYTVLIVDDEKDIHTATKLALSNFTFDGVPIELKSCYSAAEATSYLKSNTEVAVILLDVMMEEENSGLNLVKYIRNTLVNHLVRIILRTGQPGIAIEEKVIIEYDINDYKNKADLTRKKLFTSVYSSIRAYRDIMKLLNTQKGLKKIIETTGYFFDVKDRTFQEFVANLLDNLVSVRQYSNMDTTQFDSFFF